VEILFLSIDLYSRGGIQRYSRYQLRALSESLRHARITACSLVSPGEDAFEDAPRVRISGGRRRFRDRLLFSWRVLGLTASLQPDLIICDHINLAPLAVAASVVAKSRVLQFVYAIEVWGKLPFLRRAALLRVDRIVSDCDFTARHLIERYPNLNGRVEIIKDCVDCERFQPAARQPDLRTTLGLATSFVILTVSRLAPERSKGHESVMDALVSLRRRHPRIKYVIAGDGGDRSRLEAEAAKRGLSDSVIFLGAITESELPVVYNTCDIFVLLSAFQMDGRPQGEGVPLVVLEAQACGKPAIASARDGSAEAIEKSKTGLLVDPADMAGLAEAISVLFNVELRAKMGAAARQRAVEQFSFEVFATKLTAVVKHVVG
jgi:phosphatidylinositol alpha-1,6-mannosyltransferase